MTVTYASFIADFPEFSNATEFLESDVNFWIAFAGLMLPQSRWGQPAATATSPPTAAIDFGTELFVAHNVALGAKARSTAASGGVPGEATGMTSNKSVGQVSVGYDTASVMQPGAGHWNLTTYGQRFARMARMFGAGPMQIGPTVVFPPLSGIPWVGPWPYPGWFSS